MPDITIPVKQLGEASKIKDEVSKFISPEMNGIDIGSGGVPVMVQAISMDISYPGCYSPLVQLKGDARVLYWFRDSSLDYVFSSHCLEDFTNEEKPRVLREWVRVIKPGGMLLLYLPDEQVYRRLAGNDANLNHKAPVFDIDICRNIVTDTFNNELEEIHAIPQHGDYCFFLVYKKKIKQVFAIAAYNRPSHLDTTLQSIYKVRGVDKWSVFISVDEGAEPSVKKEIRNVIDFFPVTGYVFLPQRLKLRWNYLSMLRHLVDCGYNEMVITTCDMLFRSDTIEYLDRTPRDSFFTALNGDGSPPRVFYCDPVNLIRAEDVDCLYNYAKDKEYLRFVHPHYGEYDIRREHLFSTLCEYFMYHRKQKTHSADKPYIGHFGVAGTSTNIHEINEQIFKGDRTQWLSNAASIFTSENFEKYPLTIMPKGFVYE